ncbi:MAG: hypothetical protein FJX76_07750 [Armatimonadetes bacterium]|nr:hypothetical protein [Armatimonadota bacterium]
MKIRATAPNRVDLAGGTLDIYPLYLFMDGGVTVNLGIDVNSTVEVETRADKRVVLHSRDFGQTVEAESVDALVLGAELDLLARAVKFFSPSVGVNVTTENRAPKGSGLGASSALLMALLGALARVTGTNMPGDTVIDWGANLEAQSIAIPTGKQDYYGAVYGGASAIHFGVKGARHERIPLEDGFRRALEERLVLSFTGISHFSGTNNWNMMKRYIDGAGDTVPRLNAIKETAYRMREALLARDFARLATVIEEEWTNRKGLAEGVTTPEIDAMMEAALKAGAQASKVCGAGGGGCMLTLAGEGKRAAVVAALESTGARVLPFAIDTSGLVIEALETTGV